MTVSSEILKDKTDHTHVTAQEVYRGFMSLYLHQDKLSWSRIQTIGVIEGGALSVAFSNGGIFAVITLVLGTFLLWKFWELIERDWKIREHAKDVCISEVLKKYSTVLKPEPDSWHRSGRGILACVLWTLVIFNVICMIVFVVQYWWDIPGILRYARHSDNSAFVIRSSGETILSFPIQSDKDVNIDFDGSKFSIISSKP